MAMEDSFAQLRFKRPDELRGRLNVTFRGEEGIDAGTREGAENRAVRWADQNVGCGFREEGSASSVSAICFGIGN